VSRFEVGRVKDLTSGLSWSVRAGGRRVALSNEKERLRALDESCPHMGADWSNGNLQGGTLARVWHGWRFDIGSGDGLTRERARPKTHWLFREGEDLILEIPDPLAGAPAEYKGDAPPPKGGPW